MITPGLDCLTAITSRVEDLETTVNGLMGALDAIQSSERTIGRTVDGVGDSIYTTNSASTGLENGIDDLQDPPD